MSMEDYSEFMKACLAEKEENLNEVMESIFEEKVPPEIDLVRIREEGNPDKLMGAKRMTCHWMYQFLKAAQAQATPARVMRALAKARR